MGNRELLDRTLFGRYGKPAAGRRFLGVALIALKKWVSYFFFWFSKSGFFSVFLYVLFSG